MSLLKRKRLQWLRPLTVRAYTKVFGKPQLVVPTPVVGGHRHIDDLDRMLAAWDAGEYFLWDATATRRGLRLPAPSDAEYQQRYNEVKNGHVTYSPEVAQERLLGLITNEFGEAIDTFTIDPVMGPERKICP